MHDEEEEVEVADKVVEECPANALAVLDANGAALQCAESEKCPTVFQNILLNFYLFSGNVLP